MQRAGLWRGRTNGGDVRNRPLFTALSAFAEEAAWQLAADTAQGAELPFEVIESHGSRRDRPLYCYRPLTDGFIRDRVGVLGRLPAYPAAARALAALDGVGDYLLTQGEHRVPIDPRERADAALRVFISRTFSEATEFVLTPERLQRAYAELEDSLLEGRAEAIIVAPILGLRIASAQIVLGEGMSLVRGEQFQDAPDHAVFPEGNDGPAVLAHLIATDEPGAPSPMQQGRLRLRRLVSALRLFDPATVTLGPVAWLRSGAGAWSPAALGSGGRARGTLQIDADAEDELRAFCSLVARRTPRAGEIAWALRRYELGCERTSAAEALTDHLLALRALLEPEGTASGRLAGRLAALCAELPQRAAVTERVARATLLERALISGVAPVDRTVQVLADELAGFLRALLRAVLCGQLDQDVRAIADELLADQARLAGADQPG